MNFQTSLPVTATATSTLQGDGSIAINIALTVPGADGQQQHFSQAGHYIDPGNAAPLVDAMPTPAEVALGLSLRELVTARGLAFLAAKHGQPFVALLPSELKPS